MMSSNYSRALASLAVNLRLLGFEKCSTQGAVGGRSPHDLLNDKTLFTHADTNVFQTIAHFLFQCLDPQKTSITFRDCWPVLDKKQEVDFRKKLVDWYKELQANHKTQLPIANAALFLSPGGKKIVNFLHEFSRFVVLDRINKLKAKHGRKDDSIFLRDSKADLPLLHQQIQNLKELTAFNLDKVSEYEEDVKRVTTEAQKFIPKYSSLVLETKAEVDSLRQYEDKTSLENLEAESNKIREKYDALIEEMNLPCKTLVEKLNFINAVVNSAYQQDRGMVDLTEASNNGKSIAEVLSGLLSNIKESFPRRISLPEMSCVQNHLSKIDSDCKGIKEKHKKFEDLSLKLSSNVKSLEENNLSTLDFTREILPKPRKFATMDFSKSTSNSSLFDISRLRHLNSHKTSLPRQEAQGENKSPAQYIPENAADSSLANLFMPNLRTFDSESLKSQEDRQIASGIHFKFQQKWRVREVVSELKNESQVSDREFIQIERSKCGVISDDSKLSSIFSPVLSSSRIDFQSARANNLNSSSAQDQYSPFDLVEAKAKLENISKKYRHQGSSSFSPFQGSKKSEKKEEISDQDGKNVTASSFRRLEFEPLKLSSPSELSLNCSLIENVNEKKENIPQSPEDNDDSQRKLDSHVNELLYSLAHEDNESPSNLLLDTSEDLPEIDLNI